MRQLRDVDVCARGGVFLRLVLCSLLAAGPALGQEVGTKPVRAAGKIEKRATVGALRATADRTWLLSLSKEIDPTILFVDGDVREIQRIRIKELPETLTTVMPRAKKLLHEVFVGERTSGGDSPYLVGVVGRPNSDPTLEPGQRPFLLVASFNSASSARQFAVLYADVLANKVGMRPPPPSHGCACYNACQDARQSQEAWCAAQIGICMSAATGAFVLGVVLCAGVPPCEVAVLAIYVAAQALCGIDLVQCQGAVNSDYNVCISQCPP